MNAISAPTAPKITSQGTTAPTGYIAIGLRETDRGLRMVRLFTTETLPREYQESLTASAAS